MIAYLINHQLVIYKEANYNKIVDMQVSIRHDQKYLQ
jgi:hypothetical protein